MLVHCDYLHFHLGSSPYVLTAGCCSLDTGTRLTFLDIVGVSSILLVILGFVVGLALSLRSSTAYER
jgi:hypothetical protein